MEHEENVQRNQTPVQARRALEKFEGSAHDPLAQTDDEEYEIQTRKLSLLIREVSGDRSCLRQGNRVWLMLLPSH